MGEADLKAAGLRTTGPRLKVLGILEQHKAAHLSADDVYKILLESGEDVGIATVYRMLSQFEAAGMVKRLAFNADRAVYELAEEEHHDHIICTECGRVEEFCDADLEQRQDVIAARNGFRLLYHEMNLFGICAACQKEQKP